MSEAFVGEIRMFAGNFAPVGWAFCHGQTMPISENEALFALIGTTYGGDGEATFALPDLRGRIPVGQGTELGLTPRAIGQQFGTETVTLTEQQLPVHNHVFSATTATADGTRPDNLLFANNTGEGLGNKPYVPAPPSAELKAMDVKSIASTGSSQPHDNIMPSVAMNYIICLFGTFPMQA